MNSNWRSKHGLCRNTGLYSRWAYTLCLTGLALSYRCDSAGGHRSQRRTACKASLPKIIGNVMILSTMEMVAEVNVLAEKAGLGATNAQRLIEVFPKAASMLCSKRMNGGEYYQGQVGRFSLPLSLRGTHLRLSSRRCLSSLSLWPKCP